MDAVRVATLDAGVGLLGNANIGGRRQVTVISRQRWAEVMNGLGANLDPSTRRANLLVSGLDLQKSRGRMLKVGPARLRINGETRPCERMEGAAAELQAAIRERWGGGVFAEVIDVGEIRPGNPADWQLPLVDGD